MGTIETKLFTVRRAADELHVCERTVERMAEDGRLSGRRPVGREGERVPLLLWGPEVMALADAKRRVASLLES